MGIIYCFPSIPEFFNVLWSNCSSYHNQKSIFLKIGVKGITRSVFVVAKSICFFNTVKIIHKKDDSFPKLIRISWLSQFLTDAFIEYWLLYEVFFLSGWSVIITQDEKTAFSFSISLLKSTFLVIWVDKKKITVVSFFSFISGL